MEKFIYSIVGVLLFGGLAYYTCAEDVKKLFKREGGYLERMAILAALIIIVPVILSLAFMGVGVDFKNPHLQLGLHIALFVTSIISIVIFTLKLKSIWAEKEKLVEKIVFVFCLFVAIALVSFLIGDFF